MEAHVQAQLRHFVAAKGPLDAILSEFIKLQFRLKAPYHRFVRVLPGQMSLHAESVLPYMIETQKEVGPVLEALLMGLQKRRLMRTDIDHPQAILAFKTVHLGLTALPSGVPRGSARTADTINSCHDQQCCPATEWERSYIRNSGALQ